MNTSRGRDAAIAAGLSLHTPHLVDELPFLSMLYPSEWERNWVRALRIVNRSRPSLTDPFAVMRCRRSRGRLTFATRPCARPCCCAPRISSCASAADGSCATASRLISARECGVLRWRSYSGADVGLSSPLTTVRWHYGTCSWPRSASWAACERCPSCSTPSTDEVSTTRCALSLAPTMATGLWVSG
jgi:hypothetical protein